ncbi:hypothetical protein SB689_12520 [Chryseobacterium sp. SIMBA_038]
MNKSELKTIKGGSVPLGCISWDPRARCCRSWDDENQNKPTCPTP